MMISTQCWKAAGEVREEEAKEAEKAVTAIEIQKYTGISGVGKSVNSQTKELH
jgi:hypothetical protein